MCVYVSASGEGVRGVTACVSVYVQVVKGVVGFV